MKLLLISNSKAHDKGYLGHCSNEIVNFLSPVKKILFIPYALKDHNWYENVAKNKFAEMNIELTSIHHSKKPAEAVRNAQSIFIGGGNTFRLLDILYKKKLLNVIRKRILAGVPFVGTSAGSNIACPTIMTTNDMPIVYPQSFKALNLVPFQINPHYIDPDPNSKHMGETREARIKEFHEENNTQVIGLREGAWIRVEYNRAVLGGTTGAKVFRPDESPKEIKAGFVIK